MPGAPALPGEHTLALLAELGLHDDAMRDLVAADVVRQREG
jgi:hypothetical protein